MVIKKNWNEEEQQVMLDLQHVWSWEKSFKCNVHLTFYMLGSFSIILTKTIKHINHLKNLRFLLSEKPKKPQIPG